MDPMIHYDVGGTGRVAATPDFYISGVNTVHGIGWNDHYAFGTESDFMRMSDPYGAQGDLYNFVLKNATKLVDGVKSKAVSSIFQKGSGTGENAWKLTEEDVMAQFYWEILAKDDHRQSIAGLLLMYSYMNVFAALRSFIPANYVVRPPALNVPRGRYGPSPEQTNRAETMQAAFSAMSEFVQAANGRKWRHDFYGDPMLIPNDGVAVSDWFERRNKVLDEGIKFQNRYNDPVEYYPLKVPYQPFNFVDKSAPKLELPPFKPLTLREFVEAAGGKVYPSF